MNGALGGRKRARASRRALVDGAETTVGEHRDLIAREDEKSIAASRSAASERASVKQEALGASVGQSSRIG